jgi:hypothetical protein
MILKGTKLVTITANIISSFEQAALGKPETRFMDRNRTILMMWAAGDAIEKIVAISRTNKAYVWKIVRLARAGEFDRLVERRSPGRVGNRAKIIKLLEKGLSPVAVCQKLDCHFSTAWRAQQAIQNRRAS